MTDSRQAAALARAAAEAVRGLNHATRGGLAQPSDAYDVLGSLSLAASRLGPALAEVARYLDRALAGGTIGHDLGDDPCPAVEAASVFLGDARLHAASLAGDLGAAQQQLALINGRPGRKDQT